MRIFANLFLVLFLADGGCSLVDELVSLHAPLGPLSAVRNVLADAVILLAVPLYLCLGIDRRLPKRAFLPLTLFVFWCPLSALLFPVIAGNRAFGLLMAAAQVALGLLPLALFRKHGARSLTMPPEPFEACWFSLRNTLAFGAANLVVVPLAMALLIFSAANAYLATNTAGFMHLRPGGLCMTERVYRRGHRTVRLAGMIHVGEKEYYDNLAGSVAPGRTIVLAEGVTDDNELLENSLDYGRVAGFLGLTSQTELQFQGDVIEPEALDDPQPRNEGRGQAEPADILRADLDVSDFRQPTILVLNTMGRCLQESPTVAAGLMAINTWSEKNITPEMHDIIMDDILHRRNREVIHYLDKALDRYDTVVIPWGALHMKEIEADVLKRGFKLEREQERVSIDFRKLLAGML
jgi:hypothetical protein